MFIVKFNSTVVAQFINSIFIGYLSRVGRQLKCPKWLLMLNGTPGSRFGPHRSQLSASVDLPEIGTRVSVSGANLLLKDTTWKQARIEGVVVEKPKKNCRRVKWTIGSETCVSDHSVAFWKKLSQQQVVTPPDTSPDILALPDEHREEEPDEHQRERMLLEDEPDELDVSEAISTLQQGVTEQDPLCAHGQKWSLLEGGVTQCQRAKDGWLRMETRIKWPWQLVANRWVTFKV